jgi:hypothetical protein
VVDGAVDGVGSGDGGGQVGQFGEKPEYAEAGSG